MDNTHVKILMNAEKVDTTVVPVRVVLTPGGAMSVGPDVMWGTSSNVMDLV